MTNLYEIFSDKDLKIAEKIKQRRLQMLVHSYLYYELNTNIVEDSVWAKWGKELQDLQEQYPRIACQVDWSDDFKEWDASTGAFLPYNEEHIVRIANRLLKVKSPIKKEKKQGKLF